MNILRDWRLFHQTAVLFRKAENVAVPSTRAVNRAPFVTSARKKADGLVVGGKGDNAVVRRIRFVTEILPDQFLPPDAL